MGHYNTANLGSKGQRGIIHNYPCRFDFERITTGGSVSVVSSHDEWPLLYNLPFVGICCGGGGYRSIFSSILHWDHYCLQVNQIPTLALVTGSNRRAVENSPYTRELNSILLLRNMKGLSLFPRQPAGSNSAWNKLPSCCDRPWHCCHCAWNDLYFFQPNTFPQKSCCDNPRIGSLNLRFCLSLHILVRRQFSCEGQHGLCVCARFFGGPRTVQNCTSLTCAKIDTSQPGESTPGHSRCSCLQVCQGIDDIYSGAILGFARVVILPHLTLFTPSSPIQIQIQPSLPRQLCSNHQNLSDS